MKTIIGKKKSRWWLSKNTWRQQSGIMTRMTKQSGYYCRKETLTHIRNWKTRETQ